MDTCRELPDGVAMAGRAIGLFEFAGMGQFFRVAMAGRAIDFRVIGLLVFVVAVKTLVGTEKAERNEHGDQNRKEIPHCRT